jgi:hypothetical protein
LDRVSVYSSMSIEFFPDLSKILNARSTKYFLTRIVKYDHCTILTTLDSTRLFLYYCGVIFMHKMQTSLWFSFLTFLDETIFAKSSLESVFLFPAHFRKVSRNFCRSSSVMWLAELSRRRACRAE